MNPRLFALLAIPAALAIPGHASANTADPPKVNCDGLSFVLPRGEAGTVVTVTVDGRTVASQTVANQFDPVNLTVATPDRTTAHTWVVTVDSVYNADQRWSETVAPCATPVASTTTTLPVASTTSTTVPNPSTTVGTTVPTSSQPPTVITTPRPTTTIPQISVPPFRLPDTGFTSDLAGFAVGCLIGGAILLAAVRRDGAK